ncbi:MAG: Gfo/Idh/MocA family oxidoreductase [Roseiarcus sp.]|jgi:predicted dehydrogenase
MTLPALRQEWPKPSHPKPIVIIGTGGIVKDSHLPAYRKAGFPVAGLFDIDRPRAEALAREWGVPRVFATLEEAVGEPAVVFDIAAPPNAHLSLLNALPAKSAVLIQKPMGMNLDEATATLRLCRERSLQACVNFQLRFSPMMLAVRDAIARGLLGRLIDVEVHLNLVTPWGLFPHLKTNRRVEIVSHSIHYLDLIQSLLGLPKSVFARTFGHPSSDLADTRTTAILDYGGDLRVALSINHHHDFGRRFQDATFRFEGDEGVAVVKLGLLLDYPRGEPDELWIGRKGKTPERVPLIGRWFPDAFIGVMGNLQKYVQGEDAILETSVESAWRTMALVEACYASGAIAGARVADSPLA